MRHRRSRASWRWRIEDASGGPFYLRVLRPASGGYTGSGTSFAETPASTALQVFPTNLPIHAGDLIGMNNTASGDKIGGVIPSPVGAIFAIWQPPLADRSTAGPAASQSGELAYNADVVPQPGVAAVTPRSGPASGGTGVVISGHDFTGATSVNFAAKAAPSFTVDSDNQITAVAPKGPASGSVDVTVTTQGGTSATSASDRFTYIACVVPKLKGKKPSKAHKLLKAAHCTLGKVKKPKHHEGKLVVTSQSSPAGAVLADGAKVSVKLGPKHHKKH